VRQIILFGISGVAGYIVDASVTILLEQLVGVYVARIPAFVGAVTLTWIMNRSFTFKGYDPHHPSLLVEYAHYVSLMVAGLAVNYLTYAVSITYLQHLDYGVLVCVGLGSLAGMFVNFITSKKLLFKNSS
jgi:putative flippase GtrA